MYFQRFLIKDQTCKELSEVESLWKDGGVVAQLQELGEAVLDGLFVMHDKLDDVLYKDLEPFVSEALLISVVQDGN